MPKIQFVKKREPIEVAKGQNLMETLLKQGVPVASSCGGDGVCAKCRVRVLGGRENLSPADEDEKDTAEMNDFSITERLSCQAMVEGDITIDTPYW